MATRSAAARTLRTSLILGATALAGVTTVYALCARQDRQELLAEHRPFAAVLPDTVGARLAGEPDLDRARVALARALVAHELAEEADPDLARRLDRLRLAADLSSRTLRRRPTAWEPAMLLGSATYLSRSLSRDPSLVQDWPAWDRSLTLSRELAPGKNEPHRFSVLAYLELWPLLSPEKRQLTRSLVTRGLADYRTFGRLIALWLQIAEDRDEVFEAMPPTTLAWEYLTRHYSREEQWDTAIAAREQLDRARLQELAEKLTTARKACASGDVDRCQRTYHGVARTARPSQRFLPLLDTVLRESPPGPPAEADAKALAGWLAWALDLCAVGRCPLEPAPLARLAGLAEKPSDARQARLRALLGRLGEAERLEPRADGDVANAEEWGAYWLEKAAELLRRGEPDRAATALERVPESVRPRWRYRELRRAIGSPPEDGSQLAPAAPVERWRQDGGTFHRELTAASATASWEIEIASAPPAGAVVSIAVDGFETGWHVVESGDRVPVELPEPVREGNGAGAHWLTLDSWVGGRVQPGQVVPRRE